MRIRYLIPFSRKVIVPDHWDLPLQGGICRFVETGDAANALEVTFTGLSADDAPRIEEGKQEGDIHTVVVDEPHFGLVRTQLEDAAAFLQCQFNVGFQWDEAETFFEAETDDEEEKIPISSFSAGRHMPPAVLPFELLAGAIICAETERGPAFEATLVATAREAMFQERYIDSFRYSFLLIEAIYGGGKFRSVELKSALKQDAGFRGAVRSAINGFSRPPNAQPSDTSRLLASGADADALIDHLVDKRGIYFHGNLKRPDAWRAESQKEAQDLAAISAAIVLEVCVLAASAMHSPSVNQRFIDYAARAGALIVYQVDFTFRMPEEEFTRSHRLTIRMNGTKPTGVSVVEVIKHFIAAFERHAPMGSLETAVCIVQGTGKKVFEMTFPRDAQG